MMRFTDTLVEVYEKYAHERASHSPDEFEGTRNDRNF